MSMDKERMKKTKFFISVQKERKWLEEMALQGWFLENMVWGITYTFVKGEPKHMLYDIDRFSMPKNPTLEEIHHKEMFLEMAQEMGWKEVTHDEAMNYYFSKEYRQGDVNELHNDEETRAYRARKMKKYAHDQIKDNLFWMLVVTASNLLLSILNIDSGAFNTFCLCYIMIVGLLMLYGWRLGNFYEKELSMTREEWEDSIDKEKHKTVRKLIFTNKGLNKFLSKEQENGWILKSMTPTTYTFERSADKNQVYTMDSRWLTEKRWKEENKRFSDSKDILNMNNDWQLQSVKDAEARGWKFVCALENKGIVYRGDANVVEPLNDAKYDKIMRITVTGKVGLVFFVLCIVAFFVGYGFGRNLFIITH